MKALPLLVIDWTGWTGRMKDWKTGRVEEEATVISYHTNARPLAYSPNENSFPRR